MAFAADGGIVACRIVSLLRTSHFFRQRKNAVHNLSVLFGIFVASADAWTGDDGRKLS